MNPTTKAAVIEAPTDAELNQLAQQHTWFNGSHAITNYPAFARAVLDRYAALSSEPPLPIKGITRDDTVHGEEYFTRAMVEAMGREPEPTPEPDIDYERGLFELELRKQCFQKPTPEAYDLAWCMWQARASLPPAPTKGTE